MIPGRGLRGIENKAEAGKKKAEAEAGKKKAEAEAQAEKKRQITGRQTREKG